MCTRAPKKNFVDISVFRQFSPLMGNMSREKCFWSPGKVLEIFVTKRVRTLNNIMLYYTCGAPSCIRRLVTRCGWSVVPAARSHSPKCGPGPLKTGRAQETKKHTDAVLYICTIVKKLCVETLTISCCYLGLVCRPSPFLEMKFVTFK